MEKSNKRGKIPQSDWPLIVARYEAGETLASIARTYDCSPPAISYVVSRSRARPRDAESPAATPSVAERQLIKSAPSWPAGADADRPSPPVALAADGGRPDSMIADWRIADSRINRQDRLREGSPPGSDAATAAPRANPSIARDLPAPTPHNLPREVDGAARDGFAVRGAQSPDAPANGAPPNGARLAASGQPPAAPAPPRTNALDQRRTLHLSLGDTAPGGGGARQAQLPAIGRPDAANHSRPAPQAARAMPYPGRNDADAAGLSDIRPEFDGRARKNGNDTPSRKEGGSFIDQELRARVDTDVAAFLAAFDAALAQDTQESRSVLREATDRLLRAGARTRIELERMEARLPLPARDSRGGTDPAAWRQR